MHTLIANPDPQCRILLHVGDPCHPQYITVERLEVDAIGAPQWYLDTDGKKDRIRGWTAVSLIAHACPTALTSTAPTVLGTYTDTDGLRHRCSVVPDDLRRVLVHESLTVDAAGAPRWQERSRETVVQYNGNASTSLMDDTHLLACLFPAP
jgi:hypothetical protein